ncbi:hypothetical protein Lal_00009360 [Lupinus albus]|nr:hypothetical protein Lal_00009360 [Lupinus albus]
MELGRLILHEESDEKKKGISLKATTLNAKVQEEKSYDEESDSSNIKGETMALLVNKFSKFLKKKERSESFKEKIQ